VVNGVDQSRFEPNPLDGIAGDLEDGLLDSMPAPFADFRHTTQASFAFPVGCVHVVGD
jgi:hypothetical protein